MEYGAVQGRHFVKVTGITSQYHIVFRSQPVIPADHVRHPFEGLTTAEPRPDSVEVQPQALTHRTQRRTRVVADSLVTDTHGLCAELFLHS